MSDSELPDDLPLRHDLTAVATHATTEYGLSSEEIAETMREKADEIENSNIISRFHAAKEVRRDGDDER